MTKCIFRLVDCLLCSETFLHFVFDLVCFYKATFQIVPKMLCKSHMSTTILLLVRVHLFIFLYSVILVMHLFQKRAIKNRLVRFSFGSNCFLTTTEPLQSVFAIGPRPARSDDLRPVVLVQIQTRLLCSHMPKQTELRVKMHRVLKQTLQMSQV